MQIDRPTLRAIYDEIQRASRAAVARFTRGGLLDLSTPNAVGHVPPERGGTGGEAGAEPPLGNPPVDGYVLASTTAGVRSWVDNGAGGGGGGGTCLVPVTNGDATFPEIVFDETGDVVLEEVPV